LWSSLSRCRRDVSSDPDSPFRRLEEDDDVLLVDLVADEDMSDSVIMTIIQ
jgi:hypothetical protein